jgi:hypothetical protein
MLYPPAELPFLTIARSAPTLTQRASYQNVIQKINLQGFLLIGERILHPPSSNVST